MGRLVPYSQPSMAIRFVANRRGIDLYSGGHFGYEYDSLWHLIDLNAHWNSLREPHPGEDWVDRRNPLPVRLCVRTLIARDALDTAAHDPAITHQPDLGRIADLDRAEIGFLKITVDPE
jgi:hypothetical protein